MAKQRREYDIKNSTIRLNISNKVYPLEAVLNASYFFIDDFYIFISPGGAAPWLPWQLLHVGAARSPSFSSFSPWTDALYRSNWLVGMWYGSMYCASEWHPEQVLATFVL